MFITVADFVFDFDACKSIVKAGNSGRYNLMPVVSVIPVLSDAGQRIVGFVDPSLASTATNVSAQSSGVVIKSTPPDATGQFVLHPVPPGSHSLVITSAGHVTAVITGVPVVTTAHTHIGSSSVRIGPLDAATTRNATGTISVSGSVTGTNASMRALQALSGGPTIEVAGMPVDAITGVYEFSLPIAAPVKAAYAANPGSFDFAPDANAAAKYTLEASIPGPVIQTANIDLANNNWDTSFAF